MVFRISGIIYLFCLFLLLSSCSDNGTNTVETNEIKIGALLPLSGDFESQGSQMLAALNFAVEDVNSEFEESDKNTRIKLVYADTETNPSKALELYRTFIADDIRIIIGPITSTEVMAVKEAIDSSNSILISPSSTLTTLAIAGDNIYRIVPDDSKMVEAVVNVMWEKGIRQAAMFYLDNEWGESIVEHFQSKFEAKGGTYLGDVSYIGSRESELKEYLDELSGLISPSIMLDDGSTTAIQMISLDVGSVLLNLASTDTTLAKVKWFGCDGFVNTDELFSYFEDGAKFAEQVGFTSPIFGHKPTNESDALINRIIQETNSTPSEYSLLIYDALILAANTLNATGEDANITSLKEEFELNCSNYSCITGQVILNEAGDRDNGSYFFWQVVADGNSFKWEHVLTYTDGVIE